MAGRQLGWSALMHGSDKLMETQTGALHYEIRVERRLGPGLVALFPEFELREEDGLTLMRGVLLDQAALHGVLMRIRDLGLTLVAVARVAAPPPGGIDTDHPG